MRELATKRQEGGCGGALRAGGRYCGKYVFFAEKQNLLDFFPTTHIIESGFLGFQGKERVMTVRNVFFRRNFGETT